MKAGLLAVALVAAPAAHAQICTASTTGLNFATYDPFAPGASSITGGVSVSCRATLAIGVTYAVQLGAGASGSIAARRMTNGVSVLNYQLYTDAARTVVWGDGTGGSGVVSDGFLLAALATVNRTYTAYGTIPARQRVSAGTFGDVVTVLVVY